MGLVRERFIYSKSLPQLDCSGKMNLKGKAQGRRCVRCVAEGDRDNRPSEACSGLTLNQRDDLLRFKRSA